MPKTQHTCPCLHEVPQSSMTAHLTDSGMVRVSVQGIRPGPNAPMRLQADQKCHYCGGSGILTISIAHDPPPAPITGADWNAIVDGCEEIGPTGYGPTAALAIQDLLIRIEEVIN